MKTYLLFNAILCGATVLLIALYVIIYSLVIKKRCNSVFTPARVISALLAVVFVTSAVFNIMFFTKEEEKLKNYYYPNNVYMRSVDKYDTKSYASIFSQYVDADAIPGYKRTLRQFNDVKFTYYLSDYPEERIHPSFVIFVEYMGKEDPEAFSWEAVFFKWLRNGTEEASVFSSGEYRSTQLMLIGDYDTTIEEISVEIDFSICGDNSKFGRERIIIPLDVRHYGQLSPIT